MSITREKVKRLKKEAEALNPEKNYLPFATCTEQADGQFYYNGKGYKTTDELLKGEDIKASQTLIIIKKYDNKTHN